MIFLITWFSSLQMHAAPASKVVVKQHVLTCPNKDADIQTAISAEHKFRDRVSFDKYLREHRAEALYELIKKISINEPDNYVARVEKLLFEQGNYDLPPNTRVPLDRPNDEVLDELIAVHRLNPSYYKFYAAAVTPVYILTDRREDALALMDCAVAMNPKMPDTDFFYVMTLSFSRYEEAFARMQRAMAKGYSRPMEAALAAASLALNTGSVTNDGARRHTIISQACSWIDDLKAKDPDNWRMLRAKALCLAQLMTFSTKRQSDFIDTIKELRKIDKTTDGPAFYEMLAQWHLRDYSKCVTFADEGLSKKGIYRSNLLNIKASCQLSEGRPLDAWQTEKIAMTNAIRDGAADFDKGHVLIELGRNPALHDDVRSFLDSLDPTKVPYRDAWICTLAVANANAPWRPRAKDLTAWADRCRIVFKKSGLEFSVGENEFIESVYTSLIEDNLIEDAWGLQDELIKRDPSKVLKRIYRDIIGRKIKHENDIKGAMEVVRRMDPASAEGKLSLAYYHFHRRNNATAERIAVTVDRGDLDLGSEDDLLVLLKDLALRRSDPKSALAAAEEAMKEYKSGDNLAEATMIVSDWKGPRAALKYLKQHFDPMTYHSSYRLWTTWAHLLDKTGQKKESLEKLKVSATYGVHDALTLINLATTYVKDFGDCASARPFIERAAKAVTESRHEHYITGLMLKCGIHSLQFKDAYRGRQKAKKQTSLQ